MTLAVNLSCQRENNWCSDTYAKFLVMHDPMVTKGPHEQSSLWPSAHCDLRVLCCYDHYGIHANMIP